MEEKIISLPKELETYRETIESIIDEDNPMSICSRMPVTYALKIQKHLTTYTKQLVAWLEHGEDAVSEITITDEKVRLAFWVEYERASGIGAPMEIRRIYTGVCSDVHFLNMFRKIDKVLYMISPPGKYQQNLEACLQKLSTRLYEIARLPLHNSKGEVDTKTLNIILKAYALLDLKVNGPAKIKHEHDIRVRKSPEMELSEDEKLKIQAEVEKEVLMLERTTPMSKRDFVELEDVLIAKKGTDDNY